MSDSRNLLIVILLIAAGVLGYLYYDSRQHSLNIDAPGFKLEGK